jgi:hypothetical protein
MSKEDWIILRVLVAAMRTDGTFKMSRNKDVIRTVDYLLNKYDNITLLDNIDTIHEEYAK